ncbi:hypothetical protein BYT27DRAFT_7208899 [Phlegmacium glaucopus]|nr:hypothetical protein BYT27DRAFT_7208899 [Phlegmacium glaucopus]
MAKGIKAMPEPQTRHAPDYSSEYPDELEDFLEDFEELARQYRLTSREMSKMIVKYADRKTRAAWKELRGYNEDYKLLKRKIMKAAYHENPEGSQEVSSNEDNSSDEPSDGSSDSDSEDLSSEALEREEQRRTIDKVGELAMQLTLLPVSDDSYASMFTELQCIAPSVMKYLPLPAGRNRVQPITTLPSPSLPPAPVPRKFKSNNESGDESSNEPSNKSSNETSNKSSNDSSDESGDELDWEWMRMRENEVLGMELEEISLEDHEDKTKDAPDVVFEPATNVMSNPHMSKQNPTMRGLVPLIFDGDGAIMNASDTQAAVNNESAQRHTRSSNELTQESGRHTAETDNSVLVEAFDSMDKSDEEEELGWRAVAESREEVWSDKESSSDSLSSDESDLDGRRAWRGERKEIARKERRRKSRRHELSEESSEEDLDWKRTKGEDKTREDEMLQMKLGEEVSLRECTDTRRNTPDDVFEPIAVASTSTKAPQPLYFDTNAAAVIVLGIKEAVKDKSVQEDKQTSNKCTIPMQACPIVDQALSENPMMWSEDDGDIKKYMHAGDMRNEQSQTAIDDELGHENMQATDELTDMKIRLDESRAMRHTVLTDFFQRS